VNDKQSEGRERRGEVDAEREDQQPDATASGAVGAVAFALGDQALGVRLTVKRRITAGPGAHPLARLLGGGVFGGRLGRDERGRLELCSVA